MKTKYYKILSYLSIFIALTATISELFIDGSILDAVTHPLLSGAIAFTVVSWLLLITLTFIFLLFNSHEREEAFLTISNTQARDELELKALSDAIKSTFILNIIILCLIYLISSINISTEFTAKEAKENHVSIAIEVPPQGYSGSKNTNQIKSDFHGEHTKLIPQSLYSPNGLFLLILIQFLSFKFFLFLNKRALV